MVIKMLLNDIKTLLKCKELNVDVEFNTEVAIARLKTDVEFLEEEG